MGTTEHSRAHFQATVPIYSCVPPWFGGGGNWPGGGGGGGKGAPVGPAH